MVKQSSADYNTIKHWAAACMAFFGFFCLGEIILPLGETYNAAIHLSAGDMSIDSGLILQWSKFISKDLKQTNLIKAQ